jgi:pimeloyl-ACP methyl ester carboxylesterase
VGAIRLNEMYGILAFVLGRGLYGLIAILPMVLGAYLGTVLAHQMIGTAPVMRWTPTVLASVILVGLAVWIALPASTPPILGKDGKPVPGSIAELTTVKLGGHDQTIMVRAYSPNKPVLLFLNGGPGQSGLPYSRLMLEDLTRDFVIVDWDQRGTGKSYAAFEPTSTLTLEQAISDTIELAKYLCQRFNEQKIYLLGESWGTTLGVLAVQRQPTLFHAFIGSGQMVSQRETDRRLYQDVLDLAARTNNAQLASKMRSYGQPPYADIPYANAFVMGQYEALYKPYRPSQAYMDRGNKSGIGFYGVLASEYNLIEKANVLRGLIDTFSVMYPQLQGIDFRTDVKKLEVPIYILDGASEVPARRDLVLEWFKALEAPKKQLFTLENAAHSVAFEQFETLDKIMITTVLPETYETH